LDDLETRLRECVKQHRDFVLGLAAEESLSSGTFAALLKQKVGEVEKFETASSHEAPSFVKLASIDVDLQAVHGILLDLSKDNDTVASALKAVVGSNEIDQVLSDKSLAAKLRFVVQTHVTLAHCQGVSQAKMLETFKPVEGCRVPLSVTALLWSTTVMALEVSVNSKTEDGKNLPSSQNGFTHITVWYQKGTNAVEANQLPQLCEKQEAHRFEFGPPIPLRGTVSLWKS